MEAACRKGLGWRPPGATQGEWHTWDIQALLSHLPKINNKNSYSKRHNREIGMPLMLGWSPGGFDLIKISEPWSFCQGAAREVREPSLAAGCAARFSMLLLLCLCYQWAWLPGNKKAPLKVWKTQQRSVQITPSSPGKSSLDKMNTMRQTVECPHGKFSRANLLMETGRWHLQENPRKWECELGQGCGDIP